MKRPGRTKTLSISLAPRPLTLLRRRAKQIHQGNLSAAISEAAELLQRDMAMGELVLDLEAEHGRLTVQDRETIEAEVRSPRRKRRRA